MTANTAYHDALRAQAEIIASIPGGQSLCAYFGGTPVFGDGEITRLTLDHENGSSLSILIMRPGCCGAGKICLGDL